MRVVGAEAQAVLLLLQRLRQHGDLGAHGVCSAALGVRRGQQISALGLEDVEDNQVGK